MTSWRRQHAEGQLKRFPIQNLWIEGEHGYQLPHQPGPTTKEVDMPYQTTSFNVNNIYPFKEGIKGMLLQNLSTRLTMTATNQITNNLCATFTTTKRQTDYA